jgi:hypothetical protein
MTKAADFLLKMHDDEFGGYYNRVTPELKVIDDTKGGFQSFAIFSLAHVGRVSKNQKYTKAALDAYHELKAKMSDGPFISGNSRILAARPSRSRLRRRRTRSGRQGRGRGRRAAVPRAPPPGFNWRPVDTGSTCICSKPC